MHQYALNDVFTPGGQPSVTYIARDSLNIDNKFARCLAQPNVIVSLTGPTKSGKTVLCKKNMESSCYVWIDGGQVQDTSDFWNKVCHELNLPLSVKETTGAHNSTINTGAVGCEVGLNIFLKLKTIITTSGSQLSKNETERNIRIDSMSDAITHLINNNIFLVVDDFHYLPPETRLALLRNLKGAIFHGLKVVLLSVTYRAFEAIKAEPELTGRLRHVEVPEWSVEDLNKIAQLGFGALNSDVETSLITNFANEANESPLLMQQFCWELCWDNEVKMTLPAMKKIAASTGQVHDIFSRVALDSGFPIYQKLSAGPVTRTPRMRRPLRNGSTADIYEAILLAIADTGPKKKITYDEIRQSLTKILADNIPQRLEVSNALNHLTKIAEEISTGEKVLDWNEDDRDLNINDPYFRFYLRWAIPG